MKQKNFIVCNLLFLSFGLSSLHAQNAMIVKTKQEVNTFFVFTNLKNIAFSGTDMIVSKIDNTSITFSISSVKYAYFGNDTSTNILTPNETNVSLGVYPNPVVDQLQVQFQSTMSSPGILKIFDTLGRVVLQQSFQIQNGNSNIISVSHLARGTYICQLNSANKLFKSQFIKN